MLRQMRTLGFRTYSAFESVLLVTSVAERFVAGATATAQRDHLLLHFLASIAVRDLAIGFHQHGAVLGYFHNGVLGRGYCFIQ